jgi:hypothetical protein
MNQHIPNILLVIGTATGALSGASARLPWRVVAVQPGVEQEEYLAYDLTLGDTVQAERGSRLDAELCTKLDSLGFTTVKVRSPAHPMASLPLAEAKGQVLAKAIALPGQTQEISAGRIVDPALEERATAAGLTLVTRSTPPRLEEPITLPAELRVSTFLDQKTLDELAAAGVSTVAVKRTQAFAWQDWPGRWAFIISIFVMGVAVVLKRSAMADKGDSGSSLANIGEIKMNLLALAAGADKLADEAASLSASEIHAKLDPLISGPAYAFVENRDALKASAGIRAYAAVMDPFSRGERQLARAWSAAVDGHEAESRASLLRAAPLLHEATDAFPS